MLPILKLNSLFLLLTISSMAIEIHMPWKGEKGLTIKPDVRVEEGERVIVEKLNNKEGGFKIDILLTSKPSHNDFCYSISGHENYDFFYQPSLTQDEINQGMERDIQYVGSYAVYHKYLKDHVIGRVNYGTGKVMHIPFPYIWEIGKESEKIRAEDMTYDSSNGRLCVIAPWSFLNKADYSKGKGVRIDPTMGYTGAGVTSQLWQNTFFPISVIGVYVYTAVAGDSITSFSVYAKEDSAGGSFDMAAYTFNGTVPVTRLATPITIQLDTPTTWYTSDPVNQALTPGTIYCVAVGNGTHNVARIYNDSGSGNNRSGHNATGALPATWTHSAYSANRYSIYATVTSSRRRQILTFNNSN